jgi:chromosome segregation ATPase
MTNEAAKLATRIETIEKRVEQLDLRIDTIRTGDDAAVEALGYGRRDEAKAHLVRLETEKEQLNDQLKTLYDTRKIALTQQQQQSDVGTSMLPVRREAVLSLVEGHAACYRKLVAYVLIIISGAFDTVLCFCTPQL